MRLLLSAGSRSLLFMSLLTLALGAGLSGCKSRKAREEAMTDPQVVYERAHRAMLQSDYPLAIRIYEALMARYPFAAETRQSRLDIIYAYYKAGESESAIDAADTFIRENPTHPRIDYAWYLKGLTDFERLPNFLERWFRVDLDKRPPTEARRSFASFQTVVEQYPNSDYAHDARRRMVFLRNRLAQYEIAVARYYMGRGAYVAAAQRAKVSIEEFDGAPAVREALEIMIECYDKMELSELAAQARTMYRANYEGEAGERRIAPKKKWWKPWGSADTAQAAQ
jgi:outer membrane protein assembly factor BamD